MTPPPPHKEKRHCPQCSVKSRNEGGNTCQCVSDMRSRCKDKKIMFRNTYQYRGDRCNPSKDIQRASVQNANNDINGSYNWGYQQLSGLYGTNSYLAYTAQTGVPTNQLAYTAQKAYGSTVIRDKIQHGIGNQGRALKGSGPTMQCALHEGPQKVSSTTKDSGRTWAAISNRHRHTHAPRKSIH